MFLPLQTGMMGMQPQMQMQPQVIMQPQQQLGNPNEVLQSKLYQFGTHVVGKFLSAGQIDQIMAQKLLSELATNMSTVFTKYCNTYGNIVQSDDVTLNFVTQLVSGAINTLRTQLNAQQTAGMGMMMQPQMLNPGFAAAPMMNNINNGQMMAAAYGTQPQAQPGPLMHQQQPQMQQAAVPQAQQVQMPPTSITLNSNSTNANAPLDPAFMKAFDAQENNTMLPVTREDISESSKHLIATIEGAQTVSTVETLTCENREVNFVEVQLDAPYYASVNALRDLYTNNPNVGVIKEYAHLVSYDESHILQIPADVAVSHMKGVQDAMEEKNIVKVSAAIEHLPPQMGFQIVDTLVKQFNSHAKVWLSTKQPTGHRVSLRVDTLADIPTLAKNDESPMREIIALPNYTDNFIKCYNGSVGWFANRRNPRKFLDIENWDDLLYLIADERTGIRIGGKSSRVMDPNAMLGGDSGKEAPGTPSAEQQEAMGAFSKVFPWLFRRKLLVTTLDLGDLSQGYNELYGTTGAILRDIVSRVGPCSVVHTRVHDTYDQPMPIGISLDEKLLLWNPNPSKPK